MSVLFCEGFDNISATDGVTYHKWYAATTSAGAGGTASRSLTTGRFGSGHSLLMTNSNQASNGNTTNVYQLPVDTRTIFVGFGFMDNGSTAGIPILFLQDNLLGTEQLDIRTDSGSHLLVTRNGNILCTTTSTITTAAWYWVELGAFISSTAGWVELRISGVLSATYYGTGSSRATANGNTQTTTINSVRFVTHGGISTSGQAINRQYDDIVVNDNNGSANNDFLGDTRVVGLLPNAVGTNSGFTRTGGTASGNYTAVSDDPIDADTSYVSSSVVGTKDTYLFPGLPASAVLAIAVVSNIVARRDDAGTRSITTRIRSGGTEVNSPAAAVSLNSGYFNYQQIMETNPITGTTWLVSDVNAIEAGPIVTA